jgi:predicted metal-dependent hydrolase
VIKSQRSLEQTEFITIESEEEVNRVWEPFIHTHHYEVHADFYESWVAEHPRRTGEAYWNQYIAAKFIDFNPIPKDKNFEQLWGWFEQFKEAEAAA